MLGRCIVTGTHPYLIACTRASRPTRTGSQRQGLQPGNWPREVPGELPGERSTYCVKVVSKALSGLAPGHSRLAPQGPAYSAAFVHSAFQPHCSPSPNAVGSQSPACRRAPTRQQASNRSDAGQTDSDGRSHI
eukprot:scaffold1959_cov403-Prasinococcus_capsulatus_cf.AAC.5